MLRVQLKPDNDETLTLTEIAARSGLLSARIAQWENRFGWPISTRDARGRRRYPAHLVPDLREAARRSDLGRSLRDDIVDGHPVWQTAPRRFAPVYDRERCAVVPLPRTEAGRRLRDDLLRALDEPGDAAVLAVLARVPTIHPDDRAASVYDVLQSLGHPAAASIQRGGPEAHPLTRGTPGEAPSNRPTPASIKDPQPMPEDITVPASGIPATTTSNEPLSLPVQAAPPADAPPLTTEPAPAETAELATAETARPVEPSDPLPSPPPLAPRPKPRRSPRPTISDDTLADYQAALARERTETQARQRAAVAARERAEVFRALRAALARIDQTPHDDPALAALSGDRLARAVHNANGTTRAIVEALLGHLRHR